MPVDEYVWRRAQVYIRGETVGGGEGENRENAEYRGGVIGEFWW